MVMGRANLSVQLAAWYLGCSPTTVRKWGFGVEATCQLLDKKRPGRQPKFSEAMRLRLIAFYCQNPLAGFRTWTLSTAATYLNNHHLDIVGIKVSRSTVHRILKAHSLRPHIVKYFLHISDPDFFPKMDRIIQLYLNPPPYLFCFDECSGIQALERIGVTITTDNGVKTEFEYKRHGTLDLCAFLEVATGKVFTRVTDNHRQETLAELFAEHIRSQPKGATLHYVLDNLPGHSTQLLCETVADLAGVSPPPASSTAPERKQWLQSDKKRIIFHFTPYHGSWLNMVEIWFGIVHGKCLKGKSFRSVTELRDTLTAFSSNWDEYFAHPFRWGYTGAGLAEKVVCRLTGWLLLEKQGMKCSFMLKQLMLMTNLATDYWQQVPTKRWEALLSSLIDKEGYIQRVINTNEHSEPPKNDGKEATRKRREETVKKKRADTQKARDVLITLLTEKTTPDSRAAAA
jgi:transposase